MHKKYSENLREEFDSRKGSFTAPNYWLMLKIKSVLENKAHTSLEKRANTIHKILDQQGDLLSIDERNYVSRCLEITETHISSMHKKNRKIGNYDFVIQTFSGLNKNYQVQPEIFYNITPIKVLELDLATQRGKILEYERPIGLLALLVEGESSFFASLGKKVFNPGYSYVAAFAR